jgi:hypothetical protein
VYENVPDALFVKVNAPLPACVRTTWLGLILPTNGGHLSRRFHRLEW